MTRIIGFPSQGIGYIDGFYSALGAQGATIVEGIFAGGWIRHHVRKGDIAHFHWPAFCYAGAHGRAATLARFIRFALLLILLRQHGARIVWTAHNLLPHDPCAWPWLDRVGRRLMIALSERIFVHGPSAAALLRTRFPFSEQKLTLIPHGHFCDLYPSDCSRAAARAGLSLRGDVPVLLFLGLCKPYKNVDGLIRTFLASKADATLVIAGKFPDPAYEAACRALAGADSRIRIDAGFVEDGKLQVYLKAADVFVIPYREILTSGSAVLAASFGLPVVSIDKGFLHDFIEPDMGILYPPEAPGGLAGALDQALSRSFDTASILAKAKTHRFADASDIFLRAMRPKSLRETHQNVH